MRTLALATAFRKAEIPAEDMALARACEQMGIATRFVQWSAPTPDWTRFDSVVIRSCWDYHLNFDAFFNWIQTIQAAGIPVWNHPELLRWNANKRYLLDLEARGVSIIPTVVPTRDQSLAEVLEDRSWDIAVVKPLISASAFNTWKTFRPLADIHRERYEKMWDHRSGPMVQRFAPEILSEGELSLVYFDSKFSHAVRKKAGDGDFRVQSEFGGTVEAFRPSGDLLAETSQILSKLPIVPLFARIDGVQTSEGFSLMELELIEPELFLTIDQSILTAAAHAVRARLKIP
ncbi:MAG: hypothetical protein QNK37_33225 [Acidobacteriota bacterium]|nr:hypothetical protein [Acidobacteriota bacterium]